ncbi:aminotransferase class I/II-fold pyridoxal phosphate-dependent enzyme [Pseudoflavonifractor capillosus]|uniref:pyridoxal phosphate-dependent aminotransferase n=1 Tax=Pseudoflavonifractor TaxID=1017280 RepID=UPI000B37070A|nr:MULTISPECIES: aminotransferase class I/II-fold pyridoxal phosphate-dependent enzyme [Pseudoflavonifractor]MBM6694522.1 aminotransferase class I/II-fold pyridoxal phosphate-dependent enzyme [Pseudoflavonifractor capillosus]OUN95778.1 aromatic amino acid aminotransferase [Pseudoflavonifractor sp. An44]OUP63605.1 aromatic amino acid aminotransferase [Pseudoflavonifractor sp. An176]
MDYKQILSQRIQEVPPSGIRKYFDIMAEMDDAISLGVGEPDFQTPWHIRDAGIYSLEKGFTKYTPNAGLSDLRRAICRYLKRRFDLEYQPIGQTLVTVGGSEGLDLAFRCLLEPGDEVIIPTPSFVCYGPLVSMIHGVPVYVETKVENEFRLTPEELKAAITPRTKILVLPFPNNPTGGIMHREDLEALAEVLRGTNIMVVSDEIYAELTYGQHHVSMANIPDMYERTIVINGFSKAYSMTGWRMGYVCGPKELIAAMTKLHQYGIMSAPTTSQYAAIEAMEHGDRDIETMKQEYDGRRRFLVDGFRQLGLDCFEPRGAFYVFPCIRSTGLSSEEFCDRFLEQEHVAVIPGSAFGPGGEGFVRACYAASMKNLTEALTRLERFLGTL